MTKLEAWKAWNETVGVGAEATEFALEKSSHGKAFSYAWDAAVEAEREACLALVNQGTGEATSADALKILRMERDRISAAIRARGEQEETR